jgi:hypothetical protein
MKVASRNKPTATIVTVGIAWPVRLPVLLSKLIPTAVTIINRIV